MRKLIPAIGAFIASGLIAGAALADGLPESIKDTPVEGPQWSGFYLGAGVGYGHAVLDNNYNETGGTTFAQSLEGEGMRGGLATLIFGLDRRISDRLVVGAFVDFDWTSLELAYFDTTLSAEQKLRLDWVWAIGARAGYLLTQSTLLYVAAGYTQAEFKNRGYNDIVNIGFFPGKSSISHDGYFVAAGMEAMLGRGLSLRGELRYSDYSEEVINSGTLLGTNFVDRSEPTLVTGRLVLTYKFGHERHLEPLK
jgi:outer membrane immunogenic protein